MNYLLCDMVGTLTGYVLLRTMGIVGVVCMLVILGSGVLMGHSFEPSSDVCVNATDVQDYKDCLAEREELIQPIRERYVSMTIIVPTVLAACMSTITVALRHPITEIRTIYRTSWLNATFGFKFNSPDKEQLQMRPDWQI